MPAGDIYLEGVLTVAERRHGRCIDGGLDDAEHTYRVHMAVMSAG